MIFGLENPFLSNSTNTKPHIYNSVSLTTPTPPFINQKKLLQKNTRILMDKFNDHTEEELQELLEELDNDLGMAIDVMLVREKDVLNIPWTDDPVENVLIDKETREAFMRKDDHDRVLEENQFMKDALLNLESKKIKALNKRRQMQIQIERLTQEAKSYSLGIFHLRKLYANQEGEKMELESKINKMIE